jgi:group I intron endonuclease
MKTGIYQIKNVKTGDIYIGSTRNAFKIRKYQHFSKLRQNKHDSPVLQNSWNKYGKHKFIFEIIEYCPKKQCLKREQYYIDKLNPRFNICKIAGSRKNIVVSKETRKKLSLALTGRKISDEVKQKISVSMKGVNTWQKGRKASLETKAKISAALKGIKHPSRLGIPSWNKGIKFSKEIRQKMSTAKKGKVWTEEKKKHHRSLILKYRPKVIRNDGKIFLNLTEAAKELNVKENTIIKAITDTKTQRKVKGFKFKYYKAENKTKKKKE